MVIFMDACIDTAFNIDSLSLLESIPDAILIADSGGLIVYSNPLLEKIFGYDSKELIGKSIQSLIPDRYQTQHIKHLEQFFRSPKLQTMSVNGLNDVSGVHKNGKELHIEVNLSPYPLNADIFSMAVIRDVSERHWEQVHLQEREERLRVLLESTGAIPWAADPVSWCFNYVGPQASDILGYPIEKWYEKDFWVSRIHPDDLEKTIQFCADSSKKLSHYEFEYRMIKSDGDVIWFHDIVNVEFKNGEAHILRGFLIDITERKLAEQLLKEKSQFSEKIIDALPGLFYMLDQQGCYVRWNKKTEVFLGCSSEQLAGRKMMDFTPEEQHDEINQAIETCFREGFVYIEYDNIDKDGNRVQYASYATHTIIGDNDYMVGLELDITKQKKLEHDIRKLSNDLAHINRVTTMGELTASIAHELNQPLTAIMSNAQAAQQFLTKKAPDLEEINDVLTDIVIDDRRAGEIIKGLRKLLVKGESEYAPLNLAELIEEVVKLIRNDAKNKHVDISFEAESTVLPLVVGDRVHLQQVVLNLILNAFDAMENVETVARKLVIKLVKSSDDQLHVDFVDSGVGLLKQEPEQLFKAFNTSKSDGMGMGLTISRSIIEAHGGELGALQNNEAGATFYFSLPVNPETPT